MGRPFDPHPPTPLPLGRSKVKNRNVGMIGLGSAKETSFIAESGPEKTFEI